MKQAGSIFPVFIFTAWALGLGYLLYDNHYSLFLRPGFGPLIWVSLGITLVFLISLIPTVLSNTDQAQTLIKGLVLLLPLGFMISAGDQTLGSYALGKRPMTAPDQGLARGFESTRTDRLKKGDSESKIPISTLVRKFDQFRGTKVQVEGLFAQTVQNHDDLSAVFRYFITCCAADAQPVGVFLKRQNNKDIKNNDWVSAEGKVEMRTLDGFQVIFMDVTAIKPLPRPGKNAAYIYD